MNALQKNFSTKALADCYSRNRSKFRKAGSAGIDGVGLIDFDDELTENIADLSKQIISGAYAHKSLKAFAFLKSNGKVRWICVPTIRDRLVQRRVAEVILQGAHSKIRTEFGFGALKREGAEAERTATKVALALRQESPWVVKSDISAFFDELRRDSVKAAYRNVCRQRSLYALIDQVIDVEAVPRPGTPHKMYESGITRGRGLRQGMPLSPLLAHISLVALDNFLESRGIKFVRYVDDLVFFGVSKDEAVRAFEVAKSWLSERHLELPNIREGKTEICKPSQHVEFLGIDIYKAKNIYRMRIPSSKFDRLDGRFSEKSFLNLENPAHGEVLSALRFVSSARKSYSGVYRFLDNWPAFENKIRDYERRSIRIISKRLSDISTKRGGLSPEVLRAFGVAP